MLVQLDADAVRIRLSWWQKLLGLMRDIAIPLRDVDGVEVVEKPVSVAIRAGIKVGLRIPFLYFVARTLRLDEAFVVRRGVPGLSISVGGEGHLRRVLVSVPDAEELARRIEAARASRPT